MAAPLVDNELNKYWSLLTVVQKESIIGVIKSFIEPENSIDQYNKEIDQAVGRVESGDFYTHEEVESMSKEW